MNQMDIRLNSSKLGTKEYWDKFYKTEHQNFRDHDDTGECWFDDSGAEDRMVQFIAEKIEEQAITTNGNAPFKVLDLGTGNGHLLFALGDELEELDVNAEYTGIDYSADSVQFAHHIAQEKYSSRQFTFQRVDLLSDDAFLSEKFDILLDKGTLDAIALNQEPLPQFDGRIGMQVYSSQIEKLMHSDSIFLITSCNFTEEELTHLVTSGTSLEKWDRIEFPSFEFGGAKGSTVCSVAFRKGRE